MLHVGILEAFHDLTEQNLTLFLEKKLHQNIVN